MQSCGLPAHRLSAPPKPAKRVSLPAAAESWEPHGPRFAPLNSNCLVWVSDFLIPRWVLTGLAPASEVHHAFQRVHCTDLASPLYCAHE